MFGHWAVLPFLLVSQLKSNPREGQVEGPAAASHPAGSLLSLTFLSPSLCSRLRSPGERSQTTIKTTQ